MAQKWPKNAVERVGSTITDILTKKVKKFNNYKILFESDSNPLESRKFHERPLVDWFPGSAKTDILTTFLKKFNNHKITFQSDSSPLESRMYRMCDPSISSWECQPSPQRLPKEGPVNCCSSFPKCGDFSDELFVRSKIIYMARYFIMYRTQHTHAHNTRSYRVRVIVRVTTMAYYNLGRPNRLHPR